jgi:hypothetical protein
MKSPQELFPVDTVRFHKIGLVFLLALLCAQLAFGSDVHKKSLFLENITPLISWPENDKADFSICILNNGELLNALNDLYAGKRVNKKPVVISDLNHTDSASLCDILFIGQETKAATELTQALSGTPTLTVSDIKAHGKKGVMITMHEEDDRIACTINQKAAKEADIHVSYLLLESAYEVIK